eukprot:3268587-Alexandrium_andersonii.AAC.1
MMRAIVDFQFGDKTNEWGSSFSELEALIREYQIKHGGEDIPDSIKHAVVMQGLPADVANS